MSLEQTEKECAANSVAPRVSLSDIEAAIKHRFDFNLANAINVTNGSDISAFKDFADVVQVLKQLALMSMCVLVMKNGFIVIGKSAPASAENFNPELGRKLAYEDAIRQLWPMMGFALRDTLHNKNQAAILDGLQSWRKTQGAQDALNQANTAYKGPIASGCSVSMQNTQRSTASFARGAVEPKCCGGDCFGCACRKTTASAGGAGTIDQASAQTENAASLGARDIMGLFDAAADALMNGQGAVKIMPVPREAMFDPSHQFWLDIHK